MQRVVRIIPRIIKTIPDMKYLTLLVLIAGSVFPSSSVSQTVFYDVMLAGRIVGSVKVMLFESSTKIVKRRIEAKFSIQFYSGSFSSENDFSDGHLLSSLTQHFVNGNQKKSTHTQTEDHCLILLIFLVKLRIRVH